jgi:adhesin transport system membrane fusion protein
MPKLLSGIYRPTKGRVLVGGVDMGQVMPRDLRRSIGYLSQEVRLRGTEFETAVTDLRAQVIAAEIRRLRLEAEIEGMFDFEVPEAIADFLPDMVASERALLAARQSDYVSRTEGAQAIVTETRRELGVMVDLYNRAIAALIEVTRSRKANSDAQNTYNEIVMQAELARASEYSEVLSALATLRQDLRVAEDRLYRTVITSLMRGIVNNLGVTTIGIPLDDELFVEAEVSPSKIANVTPGQAATIKLSVYNYTIYGSLTGELQLISADAFEDERDPNAPPHYRLTLRVGTADLGARQNRIEIRPGMQADVELHTGSKTVLQYLTKPLY